MGNKRRKIINKTIAVLLVCVMVFNLCPSIVLALQEEIQIRTEEKELMEEQQIEEINEEELKEPPVTIGEEKEEAEIIGEDTEKRTLNEKHFMLKDGSMIAAIYPDNIHYEKDGKLEEIDNTLIEKTNEKSKTKEETYENKENSFKVNFNKKSKNDSLVSVEKDGFVINWFMESTTKKEIKNKTEIEEVKEVITEKISAETKLEEKIKIEKQEEISEEIKGLEKTEELNKTEKPKETEKEASTVVSEITQVEAKVIKPEEISKKDDSIKTKNEEKMDVKKIYSGVEYSNIVKDIDLKYDVSGTKIKESIILKNKENIQEEFTFNFNTGKLTAELQEDKSIIIYNETEENIIYKIEAPYMYDAKLEYSGNIEIELEEITKKDKLVKLEYKIKEQIELENKIEDEVKLESELKTEDKEYRLIIKPSKEWLEEENREYPIVIDPTIETSMNRNKIQDEIIYDGDWDNWGKWNSHIMRIGNTNDMDPILTARGRNPFRQMIKFELPQELTSGDQVIGAKLFLVTYPLATSTAEALNPWTPRNGNIQIDAHKVTQDWWEGNCWWNNLKDAYNPKVEDYLMYQFNYNDPIELKELNITSIVKDWYTTGNNYGLMLKEHIEQSNYWGMDARFFSSDVSDSYWSGYRPSVVIKYINQTGLEDYLSYHVQDVGRAGTVYTNDYNGNVTLIHPDLSTPGQRFPVSVYHVWNSNDKDKDIGYGLGFRLNLSQELESVNIGGINYMKYIDEDGTAHYFTNNTGTWTDEDGLGLTLTQNSTAWIMTDKGGNENTFYQYVSGVPKWHLKHITDESGNTITINVVWQAGHPMISSVIDAVGDTINLYYTNDHLVSMQDPNGRYLTYNYANISLTEINYQDGGKAEYAYDAKKLLITLLDRNTGAILLEYDIGNANRVKTINEQSTAWETGNVLNIQYGMNVTKFTDNKGYSNNVVFNNWGQAISVADFGREVQDINNVYGKSYKYGDSGGSKNKLTLDGKLTKPVTNLLMNGSVEYNGGGWYIGQWALNSATGQYTTEDKYDGSKSLKVTSNFTQNIYGFYAQDVNAVKGKTYTFSAQAKNNNIGNGTGSAFILIFYYNSAGISVQKRMDIPKNALGWNKYSTTIDYPSNATSQLYVLTGISNNTGTTYFDQLQLEEGEIANPYNYIENSSFNEGITSWTPGNTDGNDGVVNGIYKLTGDASKNKYLSKYITTSGNAGDTYMASLWVNSNVIPTYETKLASVTLTARGANGETATNSVTIDDSGAGWQYVTIPLVIGFNYTSMEMHILYYKQSNITYFDNISLIKDDIRSKLHI